MLSASDVTAMLRVHISVWTRLVACTSSLIFPTTAVCVYHAFGSMGCRDNGSIRASQLGLNVQATGGRSREQEYQLNITNGTH